MRTNSEKVNLLRDGFNKQVTLDVGKRITWLKLMRDEIKSREQEIFAALKADFNKCKFETYATEVLMVLDELHHTIKHLKRWSKSKGVGVGLINFPARGKIIPQPYGVALVMAPWNYPFMLTLSPFIGAIAAGNCVLLKPSNYSPKTSDIINTIVTNVFPENVAQVVLGGREANTDLLEQTFDFIFFTGGTSVGKLVMEAAAKNLTPLALELGGKSPVIVDATANINITAKRLVWGKYVNAGQTCVAPDYCLVVNEVYEQLLERVLTYIKKFYYIEGKLTPDFPTMINEKHFAKVSALMDKERIEFGGKRDTKKRLIEPTVMTGVSQEDAVMKEEIFGPILPILRVKDVDEAIQFINARPRPLALYCFSKDKDVQKKVLTSTTSGGACINDTVMHLTTPNLPFGGVGASGMGSYHGYQSFRTFSHFKSTLIKSPSIDLPLKYPPYTETKLKIIKTMIKR